MNHGTDDYFISQVPNHYRNFRCYIPAFMGATLTSNTVEFCPTHCDMPQVSTMDVRAVILTELKKLIQEDTTCLGKNP